jgi:hypothetical protein
MTPEQFQALLEVAGRIGGVAWEGAQRQVMINTMMNIAWVIGSVPLFVYCFRFARGAIAMYRFDAGHGMCDDVPKELAPYKWIIDDDTPLGLLCMMVSALGVLITFFIVVIGVDAILNNLLNPQWRAIELLLHAATGR